MAPALALFEEEAQQQMRGPHSTSWQAKARKLLPIPPWPSTVACVLVGMILSRILFPSPTFVAPDYSELRKAAPTLPDHSAVLSSSEALPELVANNLRLTHEECDAGFPLLWGEVTKTKSQFRRITLKDVQAADEYDGTRVAIIDNRLYVKRFHAESASRNQAVLASLYEAVSTAPENKEAHEKVWLLPDFGFWSWAEPRVNGWNDYRRRAMAVDAKTPWSKKFGKLFWRGAFLSQSRKELKELVKDYEWSDIEHLDWGTLDGRIEMEDHCKHRYLASIEGNSAFAVSHKMKWVQHFHPALDADPNSPDQNIVELQTKGWSEDLELPRELYQGSTTMLALAPLPLLLLLVAFSTPALTAPATLPLPRRDLTSLLSAISAQIAHAIPVDTIPTFLAAPVPAPSSSVLLNAKYLLNPKQNTSKPAAPSSSAISSTTTQSSIKRAKRGEEATMPARRRVVVDLQNRSLRSDDRLAKLLVRRQNNPNNEPKSTSAPVAVPRRTTITVTSTTTTGTEPKTTLGPIKLLNPKVPDNPKFASASTFSGTFVGKVVNVSRPTTHPGEPLTQTATVVVTAMQRSSPSGKNLGSASEPSRLDPEETFGSASSPSTKTHTNTMKEDTSIPQLNSCFILSAPLTTTFETRSIPEAGPSECYVLPEEVSMEEGALLEPLAVACMSVSTIAECKANSNVVIFGAGPVGLLAMSVAKALGAKTVIAVDVIEGRLTFAKEFAATDYYLPSKMQEGEDRITYSRRSADELRARFGFGERGPTGVDLVVDCTGAEICIQTGLFIAKHGGKFVQVGMGAENVTVPITQILAKELTVKGSFRYGPGCYALALDLVARGLVNLKPLITHRYTFKEAELAFKVNQDGKSSDGKPAIKIIIDGPL
ncbi:hypothetical protein P7C70_g620, partial [Phenoliferia sp. Uapishka_3]